MMYWCLVFKSFVIFFSMKDLGPFFKNVNDCLQWTFHCLTVINLSFYAFLLIFLTIPWPL